MYYYQIVFVFFIISMIISVFLAQKPQAAISIQKKFYERLNWRIEPISMEKEVRDTRLMGFFLGLITVLASIYVFFIV